MASCGAGTMAAEAPSSEVLAAQQGSRAKYVNSSSDSGDSPGLEPPSRSAFIPWEQLPVDTWRLIGSYLTAQAACRGAASARVLKAQLLSTAAWAQRARDNWARFSCFSDEQCDALAAAFSKSGLSGYAMRRSMLRHQSVAICSGKKDRGNALMRLAVHLGSPRVQRGMYTPGQGVQQEAEVVLVEQGGHARVEQRSWRRGVVGGQQPLVVGARWLPASCVAGRRLPAHRPGCPSANSAFSLPRSCIAAPRHAAGGFELCCFAPRLLEGCLVSASRVVDRTLLAATVMALGGEYTEELTPLHSHLIAGDNQGRKVEMARAHRIHVVSPGWLLMTHRHGTPMQERCFAVR